MGVCDEAYEEQDNNCVSRQLAALLRTRKGEIPFTLEEVEERFESIIARLYPDDADSPYCMLENGVLKKRPWREVGITPEAIVELCRELAAPVHVVWARCKIVSFVPASARWDTLALYVHGAHAYFCADSKTKEWIAKRPTGEPPAHPEWVLAVERRTRVHKTEDWTD